MQDRPSLVAPAVVMGTVLLLLSLCCSGISRAEPATGNGSRSIAVLESESGGHYREFGDDLRALLGEQGFDVTIADASGPMPKAWLVIGVGMKAAGTAAASQAPFVLNVLIPAAGHDQLLQSYPQRASNRTLSAVFIDQPVGRQAELINAAFPGSHNIGVLYTSPADDLAQLGRNMAEHGLALHAQEVSAATPLPAALQTLLPQIDVLLARPDPRIYNSSTIRNILLSTYRSEVPMVGFSVSYVNAGAVLALSSSVRQMALQAAEMIRLLRESGSLPGAQYPNDFEISVNDQVAGSLGIHSASPSELHEKIRAAERKAQ